MAALKVKKRQQVLSVRPPPAAKGLRHQSQKRNGVGSRPVAVHGRTARYSIRRECNSSQRSGDRCNESDSYNLAMAYYVAISDQGPAWKVSVSMREQGDWAGHAVFMNALVDDGFVVLGGPIGDGTRHRARLIVESSTEQAVRDRLADDPWAQMGLLTIESIEEWEVLLSNEPDS